ncbi:conserved protein of unknown function [Burkholderia multivorans]
MKVSVIVRVGVVAWLVHGQIDAARDAAAAGLAVRPGAADLASPGVGVAVAPKGMKQTSLVESGATMKTPRGYALLPMERQMVSMSVLSPAEPLPHRARAGVRRVARPASRAGGDAESLPGADSPWTSPGW